MDLMGDTCRHAPAVFIWWIRRYLCSVLGRFMRSSTAERKFLSVFGLHKTTKGVFKHDLRNNKALCQLCMTLKPKFKVLVAFEVIRCKRIGRTNEQHSLYSFVITKTAITTPVQIVRYQSAQGEPCKFVHFRFWHQVELNEKMSLYFNFLTKLLVTINNHLYSCSVKAVALWER